MGLMEVASDNAESIPSLLTKLGGGVIGIGAAFKMHESIDSDEQAIILNRGKVKLDRRKVSAEFSPPNAGRLRKMWPNIRRARRILDARAEAAADDAPPWDAANYAKIYGNGGKFTFFSMRAVRKIKSSRLTNGLPQQRIMLDDALHLLDSSITYAVDPRGQNAAKAMLRVRSQAELSQKVVASTASAARMGIIALYGDRPNPKVTPWHVFEMIKAECGEELHDTYGVVLKDYEISYADHSEGERNRRIIFEVPGENNTTPEDIGEPALSLVVSHVASQAAARAEAIDADPGA